MPQTFSRAALGLVAGLACLALLAAPAAAGTWKYARLLDVTASDTDTQSVWMEGDGDELYCKVNLSALTTGSAVFSVQFCRRALEAGSTCTVGAVNGTAAAVTLVSSVSQSATNANVPLWLGPFTPASTFVPTAHSAIAPVPALWRLNADITGTSTGATYQADCYWR